MVTTDEIPPCDGALLRSFSDGDHDAGAQLYRRYAGRVIALARGKMSRGLSSRLEADDVAQSVFRRLFDAARQGRYLLPSGQELWDLLLVITLNRLRSLEQFHRAGKRDLRQAVDLDTTVTPLPARGGSGETLLTMAVDEAIASLPEQAREIVRLRMEGYEIAEISQQTERSKRTVERLLQDTRSRLTTLLRLEMHHDDGRSVRADQSE